MRSIVYIIISLCLAGFISKKDKTNHHATTITYDIEDVNDLTVINDERFSVSQELSDIKVVRDRKAPLVNNAAVTSSAVSDKIAKYAEEQDVERNHHAYPRTPLLKSRHEKMMEASPIFQEQTPAACCLHIRNVKK